MSLILRRLFERERLPLIEQMNDLFDETMAGSEHGTEMGALTPSVKAYANDGAIMVQAELPGVAKEGIRVHFDGGVLTVSGERKLEKQVDDNDLYHCELAFSCFSRSFALPPTVEGDKIEACFKHGILSLRIPKSHKAKGKRVGLH